MRPATCGYRLFPFHDAGDLASVGRMKSFCHLSIITLAVVGLASAVFGAGKSVGTGKSFQGPVGLQLYSLRAQFAAQGVPPTLDTVKGFGIRYAELAGTYDMPAERFKEQLAERGIKAVSAHFPYKRFKEEPE